MKSHPVTPEYFTRSANVFIAIHRTASTMRDSKPPARKSAAVWKQRIEPRRGANSLRKRGKSGRLIAPKANSRCVKNLLTQKSHVAAKIKNNCLTDSLVSSGENQAERLRFNHWRVARANHETASVLHRVMLTSF